MFGTTVGPDCCPGRREKSRPLSRTPSGISSMNNVDDRFRHFRRDFSTSPLPRRGSGRSDRCSVGIASSRPMEVIPSDRVPRQPSRMRWERWRGPEGMLPARVPSGGRSESRPLLESGQHQSGPQTLRRHTATEPLRSGPPSADRGLIPASSPVPSIRPIRCRDPANMLGRRHPTNRRPQRWERSDRVLSE